MLFHNVVLQNTNSEPRDVLMTERTALSWMKFALSLALIAVAVATHTRLPDSNGKDDSGSSGGLNSTAIAVVFIVLSLGCVFFGAFGYFQMVNSYDLDKIRVLKFEYSVLYIFVMGIVLMGINAKMIYNDSS